MTLSVTPSPANLLEYLVKEVKTAEEHGHIDMRESETLLATLRSIGDIPGNVCARLKEILALNQEDDRRNLLELPTVQNRLRGRLDQEEHKTARAVEHIVSTTEESIHRELNGAANAAKDTEKALSALEADLVREELLRPSQPASQVVELPRAREEKDADAPQTSMAA